uniref:tumor necrosis factor ligand superfamily member 11 n=1 Tax=Doryrhamphus excisus TaxID=161450 RepID=UPI0025AE5AD9|nr:tumor necrosis factor ligand superfamily member 11 [Doryrhamphus excisus]XP_057938178.1 tumor necrosis factor ligand superfamily member 11 [Doryrhamphus excisus]XP_057938180.1 tumor necrosis factor ligand superfamily member 11 [Doryrhamphus excisus]XP_057938181.1 tumor necrosis factor ligand superfamily member 11 [Doryrhamphus excisus]XP_057938182.1 tumor necrosis factor ligand superfamily member 11 [Doryrhamphus excisus]
MAATHGEYRGYLRSTVDVEAGQHRFQPVASSEPSHRPLLFGTLAVMGLLQVASSVAILLHLTGYLQEVDLTTAPHRPIEEVQTEPVLNALRDTKKNRQFKNRKDHLPSAHLPIKVHQEFSKKGEPKAITIDWDEVHGYRHRMNYEKGKLLVVKSGFYYVYAKTCFRYYKYVPEDGGQGEGGPSVDVSNTQLIQYIYHERIKQNSKVDLLMKTGSTMRWDNTSYNMYCAQQGRGLLLEEGDALFVTVSNAWMLDPDGVGTYFGAVKLGN